MVAYTTATLKQLAAQAGRGSNKALESALRLLNDHIDELSAVEVAYLDGVTAGTGLDSKALVLGSDGAITLPHDGYIKPTKHRFEMFDDFYSATADVTDKWITFVGSGGTLMTHVDSPEGKVTLTSGGVGDTNDGCVMSSRALTMGALVSDGQIVFQTRVSMDDITGTSVNFGLSDAICTAAERNLYKVNSGTISDGGLTLTNAVCLAFDTDATAPTFWQFCSENAGTIAAAAAEDAHSAGPTADTYATIRIEVDATGDARTYLDGTLINTETTAVATTSVLVPFIGTNSADDADIATVLSVDYIYFSGVRPSSNA